METTLVYTIVFTQVITYVRHTESDMSTVQECRVK
jgi:hypothetical protein